LRKFVIYVNHRWMPRAFDDRLGIMTASIFI